MAEKGTRGPERKWTGLMPKKCDLCYGELSDGFVDGKTSDPTDGRWAIMCVPCHRMWGIGLGTGKGQWYDSEGLKLGG